MQEFKINVLSLDMDFEVTVIGAGVIGLCIARKLCKKNFDTVVIEKNKSFGKEGSSRNSGVIHAGIYYKKSSKKSIFCKIGNKLLYEYIKEKKINHLKCGKLIVASCKSEDVLLKDIKKNASKNGVNLIYYNRKQTNKIEPQLNVHSSLFSPTTGTVDVHEFMLNLESDIINDNTTFNLRAYEIPLQSLIYIKISEKIFLNNAFGLSVNILASDIYSEGNNYTEFTQNTFKRRRIQTALIANLGAEFRTEKNKIFYLGFSLHRPWKEIARIYPKIQNFNNTSLSNAKYIEVPGNFLTIDFRYFLSDS